jgi:Bacterial membrane protein YfhO
MMAAKDFRERAWIAASGKPYERDNGPGRVTVRTRPRRYDIKADMERDGWIVISESGWNGWRAYIDGRRVQMQRANMSFLSVHVPAGSHRVKLVYLPQSFVIGRAISLLTVAGLVAFAVFFAFYCLWAPRALIAAEHRTTNDPELNHVSLPLCVDRFQTSSLSCSRWRSRHCRSEV